MSNILYAVEGETAIAKEVFVDEYNEPYGIANTEEGPVVRLFDTDNAVIAEQVAIPDHEGQIGEWAANIPVPKMGLTNRVELRLVWTFKTEENDIHRSTQVCFVEPSTEGRETDIVVLVGRDSTMQVNLPFAFHPTIPEIPANLATNSPAVPSVVKDSVRFSMYRNNTALYANEYLEHTDPSVSFKTSVNKTTFTLPATVGQAKLEPVLLIVELTQPGQTMPQNFSFKVWPITPQMLIAVSQIEDFINKARLENVIPELEYTQADILQYLKRGLDLFNSLPPQLTAFTGTNMQGNIADSWLTCASYYALASQLQAEGALAFDFSGQTVNLNIDRTPAIESALGRVEAAIDNIVKPFKKLLAKAGVLGGDGSVGGGFINGSTALGTLSVINAPTTRLPHSRRGSWFRPY
jgi:hypothetical protein